MSVQVYYHEDSDSLWCYNPTSKLLTSDEYGSLGGFVDSNGNKYSAAGLHVYFHPVVYGFVHIGEF